LEGDPVDDVDSVQDSDQFGDMYSGTAKVSDPFHRLMYTAFTGNREP
jgi:hypothetical protein